MEIKVGKYTFRLWEIIGTGNFSVVYEAELTNGCLKCRTYNKKECKKNKHNLYALKKVLIVGKNEEYLERERKILKKLDHENIVKLYESYKEDKFLYLILEYIDGITLKDHLKKKVRLKEKEAFDIFSQVVNGVKYLPSKLTMHRYLKPGNILLEKPDHKVKIMDLGLSKNHVTCDDVTSSVVCTPISMPLEAYKHVRHTSGHASSYAVKFDVWRLGILLYKLLVGKYPVFGCCDLSLVGKDVKKDYVQFPESEYLSEEAYDLLKSMFEVESSRIDILGIERTRFFTKYSSKKTIDSGLECNSSSSRSRNSHLHGRSYPKEDSGYSHGGSIRTNESISDYKYSDSRHPYLSDRNHLTEQRQNMNSQATFRGRSSSPTRNHPSAERKPPSPLNTVYLDLQPTSKTIKNLTLEIRSNGDVYVSNPDKSICISNDGMKIEVTTSGNNIKVFTLKNLPKKYWALYDAGKEFVNYEIDRRRKVVYFGEKAAFTIFGNSDIEMKFYDGGVVSRKYGDREVCYTDKHNSVFKEDWSKFKTDFDRKRDYIAIQEESLRDTWEEFNEMFKQCGDLEERCIENNSWFPVYGGDICSAIARIQMTNMN